VRNGPAHELTTDELVALWSVPPQETREVLSAVIADEVVHPQRTRTLSEAVGECEAKRRRQLGRTRAQMQQLRRWQERQRNGGAPATGRPKAQQNRYSGQQLQALSRAWDRFATDHGDEPPAFDAFVRSLPTHQRAWLPKTVKADTVRKLIQQGSGLRRASKTWRARPDVRDALYRLMRIETSRREVNRIVRELASLQPGTEIAERRISAFVSETVWRHRAMRKALGIEDSFIKL
jgi:hypothetical protein